MGPGLPAPGGPQQSFHPQSLQIRTCPQENPVLAKVVQLLSPWSQARAEQVGVSTPSWANSPLAFPLLKWEERDRADQPPLIFFACKTGSLDAGNMA